VNWYKTRFRKSISFSRSWNVNVNYNTCEPCQCLDLTVWWLYSVWSSCTQAWQGTLNLDSLPTGPVCTPGSLINKFFCFDSTVALTITPIVKLIAPARQHIQSTCTGGNASIVSYPPADATLVSGVCGVCTVKSLRRDNKNSTTAERPQEKIERRDQGNCEKGNSAVREGGYSRQQVRVQAADRSSSSFVSRQRAAGSCPGSGQRTPSSCPGSG